MTRLPFIVARFVVISLIIHADRFISLFTFEVYSIIRNHSFTVVPSDSVIDGITANIVCHAIVLITYFNHNTIKSLLILDFPF